MDKSGRPQYGSDLVVDLMKAVGIEYVALNPGSTFRGVHDSLVNYGSNNPRIIFCNHEEIAVAIAHGYGVASGKPMAAMNHNVVGLLHASMAIYNAWCDMAPVMVIGGGGPMDVDKRRNWVDWVHIALVQGNIVRDYVKWDDQPFGLTGMVESFLRAYRITCAKPQGPVYLCLDSALQEAPIEEPLTLPPTAGALKSTPIAADPDAIEKIAGWLLDAQMPAIIADRMGGDPEAVKSLVELADLLSVPVMDLGRRFNFPNTHPLDLTGALEATLAQADLVLALEVEDLFGALNRAERAPRSKPAVFRTCVAPEAKVVDISLRDLATKGWAADYQRFQKVDLAVTADATLAVRQLIESCRRRLDKASASAMRGRKQRMADKRVRLREQWRKEAEGLSGLRPIATAWLAHEVGEVLKNEDWVLAYGEMRGWPRRLWDWDRSYRYVGASGGGGLGYGLGASIGVALAHKGKGRIVVDLQPDGDMLYTPQAIWTAVHEKVPLLIVMYNNRAYFNSETHAGTMAKGRGRPLDNCGIGTRITEPNVDFAALARSFGARAEGPIEDPAETKPALQRAVNLLKKDGMPVLVDIVCGKEERGGGREE